MELLLIRHGLPVRIENRDGTPADPPLSDTGRDQAERVAAWLEGIGIDAIYASPLLRARETALPLARRRRLDVRIEQGISEYDADSELYIPMEELKATDYERWHEVVSGGYATDFELKIFHDVVVAAMERIIAAHSGSRVAVFCHGGVINCWATKVLGMPPRLFVDATYTGVSRFMAATSGERSLGSLNETAHLRGLS